MIIPLDSFKMKTIIQSIPPNWKLLSPQDMKSYQELQSEFHKDVGKSRKGERLDTFLDKLNKIKMFIEKGDENDWKRSIVCGVFFLDSALAIQIQQLRMLLGRCKSSINGSLQALGYSAQSNIQSLEQKFLKMIPMQFRDASDLKKWTIRKNINETKNEMAKNINIDYGNGRTTNKTIESKKTTFLIELPDIWKPKPDTATEVKKIVQKKYPCHVKCRYKFYELIHHSVSIQTEA
ncbi:hypothetical protein TRFO_33891 [Tritrichomonas foetus]|uniref:Initiator binding domain-containing protein n=1 Tax=Tritrichomonas foetus TaxID=1144522 RepID=A0A1J4JQ04_9EUKA|nr:hypothetical protein TRFO_33891 [Tritrichomonas foetus]|eukprot:OHS99603.1 hypothetical protein TRFO_33891 [Tritrichomonas foetus]